MTYHSAHPALQAMSTARFIRLGPKSTWAPRAIEEGILLFDHPPLDEDLIRSADRRQIADALVAQGVGRSVAGQLAREIIEFHHRGAETVWITFWRGRLWWGISDAVPEPIPGRPGLVTYRRVLSAPWRSCDLAGRELQINNLPGNIAVTAGYQRTICVMRDAEHVLRLIRGAANPLTANLTQTLRELDDLVLAAIRQLNPKDFELLADLMMTRGGWHRVSAIGGTQADFDGHYEEPLRGRRAAIQVKGEARRQDVVSALAAHRGAGHDGPLYFFCHSPRGDLAGAGDDDLELVAGAELALCVQRCGLLRWVSARSA